MTISIPKTKTMVISRQKKHQIGIGQQALEQINQFKYLGAVIVWKNCWMFKKQQLGDSTRLSVNDSSVK
uniref:Uncharacterized protein n=1 Tax=Arion vulgaris TaxID=1028688 RepID=A0A0B6ZV82_9EUPU